MRAKIVLQLAGVCCWENKEELKNYFGHQFDDSVPFSVQSLRKGPGTPKETILNKPIEGGWGVGWGLEWKLIKLHKPCTPL